jgi:hypothetical protein
MDVLLYHGDGGPPLAPRSFDEIEAADVRWFRAHPDRCLRLRRRHSWEHGGPDDTHCVVTIFDRDQDGEPYGLWATPVCPRLPLAVPEGRDLEWVLSRLIHIGERYPLNRLGEAGPRDLRQWHCTIEEFREAIRKDDERRLKSAARHGRGAGLKRGCIVGPRVQGTLSSPRRIGKDVSRSRVCLRA